MEKYDPNKLSDITPLTIKQAGCINALTGAWFNHKAGVSMRRASVWISALKEEASKSATVAEIRAWKTALAAKEQGKTPPGLTERAITVINRDITESTKTDLDLAKIKIVPAVTVTVKENSAPAKPVRIDVSQVSQDAAPPAPAQAQAQVQAQAQAQVQVQAPASPPIGDTRMEVLRRKAALLSRMMQK